MTEIRVRHGDQKEIKKILNISYPTIRKALRGETNNYTSLKIRKLAIEQFNGMEVKTQEEKSL